MDLGLRGRVAVVTAASKGLGRACAQALSEEGATVVICARGEEGLREAEAAMAGEVLAITADVTHPETPAQLVQAAVETYGRLDVVVGNAGGPPTGRALEVSDEQILAAVNANQLASIRLVRAAVPHLRDNRWGRVCLITSRFVKEPSPTLVLSNVARTGLWAWAKTAAKDLFGHGITLNLVCPGYHATDRLMQIGGLPADVPVGDPADFGRVVAFLCSEPAGFVSGAAVQVDGAAIAGLL